MSSNCKMGIMISDVVPTDRPEIVEITRADTGGKARLRRDMCEFFPGKVFVPWWLGLRIMDNKETS